MWANPQFPEDFVTFIEEILNEELYFLRSVSLSEPDLKSITPYIVSHVVNLGFIIVDMATRMRIYLIEVATSLRKAFILDLEQSSLEYIGTLPFKR